MSTQSIFLSDTPQIIRPGTGGSVRNFLSQVELRILTIPHPHPHLYITPDTICTQIESTRTISITIGRHESEIPYCLYDVILNMRAGEVLLLPLSFSGKLGCKHLETRSLTHSHTAVQIVSFKRYESLHTLSAGELLDEAERQKLSGNDLFKMESRGYATYHYSMAVKLCILANSHEDSAILLKKICISNLSACWLHFGNFERTVETTQKVLEIEPTNEKALYRQAVALKQLNEFDRALVNIKKILSFNSNNREAIQEMTLIRNRQKECLKKEREKYSKLFS
ncbi:hypothetical protein LOD99_7666 [Oopsacas minuta]|uniref:peptidylprolyl isomerase n=1 Tax=Oopsacas minuta TaxID=111878 RepID=A0AAV7JP67_9METZ|nr:hypothetical protein LOD99_7666 [Oopsacas minuta]